MSNGQKGSYPTGTPDSYYPNENLVVAIVRAWSDPGYRDRLLTFPDGAAADWKALDRAAAYRKTSSALAEVDVFINSPIVITEDQRSTYVFPKQSLTDANRELLFVLPAVFGSNPTAASARIAMAVTPCGI